MPPWIYSESFWANLRAVLFPQQWLAARTAGVDLTKVINGSEETVGPDGLECSPVTDEGSDRMGSDSIDADTRGAAGRTAASPTDGVVTRRHVHMVNGNVE